VADGERERSLAVFIDFENLALGFQNRRDRFEIARVLERLVEKGKIVVKKAYADWNRFSSYTAPLHEAAIELIEIPRRAQSGKNSADIRLCVDAMDLAYSKDHIDTFCVVSGDSDFSPLVSKLKELGKHVIGLGMQESTSDLLRDNCDEFIYYEDLGKSAEAAPPLDPDLSENKRKAFALLLEALLALRRENKDVLWSSMIKDTMKRKKPSFNETYHGYRTFSQLLEDAQREGIVELDTDKRSRTYVVTRFGEEIGGDSSAKIATLPTTPTPTAAPTPVPNGNRPPQPHQNGGGRPSHAPPPHQNGNRPPQQHQRPPRPPQQPGGPRPHRVHIPIPPGDPVPANGHAAEIPVPAAPPPAAEARPAPPAPAARVAEPTPPPPAPAREPVLTPVREPEPAPALAQEPAPVAEPAAAEKPAEEKKRTPSRRKPAARPKKETPEPVDPQATDAPAPAPKPRTRSAPRAKATATKAAATVAAAPTPPPPRPAPRRDANGERVFGDGLDLDD
jgi:uncharacterized protein (TIGR00288 family)